MMAEFEPAYDGAGCDVPAAKQAEAVRMWAEYWGTACPDCGPQDYDFMLEHALSNYKEVQTGVKKEKNA